EETKFAQTLQSSFNYKPDSIQSVALVPPLKVSSNISGSTDVADVSWAVPTVGMSAATWVAGTPAHSWQAVACGGTSIGTKGMMVAAKTIALTAIDLLANKNLLDRAKEEWVKSRGPGYNYKALLGDRKPALNYRDQ
ncbi:MAG: amidohydrolase, partial [Chitinophagaceae bacterium]